MSASLSALESASVESVWQTRNARHQVKNPGWSAGQLVRNAVARANGRRKVKRPQTLMYSSRAWPRRFVAVLGSTWNSAAARARASHMAAIVSQGSGGTAGWAQAKSEAGTRARPPNGGGAIGSLPHAVDPDRRRRQDLDHERRRTLDASLAHGAPPVVRDEDDIGLDDRGVGQNHVLAVGQDHARHQKLLADSTGPFSRVSMPRSGYT